MSVSVSACGSVSVSVNVCVSPSVSRSCQFLQECRGQQGIHSSAANADSCGHSAKQIGTPICVPASNTMTPTVHPASAAFVFDSIVVLRAFSPSLFPPQLQPRRLSRSFLSALANTVEPFTSADSATLRFPHPFSGLWLTETPVTKCVSLRRPTRVHSVIPRKGALKPSWITY